MPTLTSMRRPLQTLKDPLHIILSPPWEKSHCEKWGLEAECDSLRKRYSNIEIAQPGGLYWKGLLDGNNF
jgi:hypothetical protein